MSQTVDIRELNERIESKSSFVNMITMGMDQVIVGQKHLVESLLIGLLSDGHIRWKVCRDWQRHWPLRHWHH